MRLDGQPCQHGGSAIRCGRCGDYACGACGALLGLGMLDRPEFVSDIAGVPCEACVPERWTPQCQARSTQQHYPEIPPLQCVKRSGHGGSMHEASTVLEPTGLHITLRWRDL